MPPPSTWKRRTYHSPRMASRQARYRPGWRVASLPATTRASDDATHSSAPNDRESPLAIAAAMRSDVKLPGPLPQTTRVTWPGAAAARASVSAIAGIRRSSSRFRVSTVASASSVPSWNTATLAAEVAASRARVMPLIVGSGAGARGRSARGPGRGASPPREVRRPHDRATRSAPTHRSPRYRSIPCATDPARHADGTSRDDT